ncbi:Uncharacterized protein dnm_081090 [Desulfonema magnum]|uniref:Uncharacterized protein n=1 Tax=Desulfonema magnum TaxID=45655 RepID=A0A975BVS7_9BACT|nr:Uncharacterized protein dnm_081090 [Desulfonema magnum]
MSLILLPCAFRRTVRGTDHCHPGLPAKSVRNKLITPGCPSVNIF